MMHAPRPIALALALSCLLPAAPSLAQSQDEVLSARIRPGWREPSGNFVAAVDLALAPGWKTYWRAPGEAGIPPSFDWSGSENLKEVRLHWPAPQVISLNGIDSIGYRDRLVLPVEVVPLDPGRPVALALRMELGVCENVCMPAEVAVAARLEGAGAADAEIERALQAQPISPEAAGLAEMACDVAPIADGLRLTARMALPEQGGTEAVAIETDDRRIWVSWAQVARGGGNLTAVADLVPPQGRPFALDRSQVTVTVIAARHAVEIRGCPAP